MTSREQHHGHILRLSSHDGRKSGPRVLKRGRRPRFPMSLHDDTLAHARGSSCAINPAVDGWVGISGAISVAEKKNGLSSAGSTRGWRP
jgi:hypothetical protein